MGYAVMVDMDFTKSFGSHKQLVLQRKAYVVLIEIFYLSANMQCYRLA